MDESEDQEGKEAGANSTTTGCDVPKEARSLVTSDQNDLDNKDEDELGEQVEEEEQKLEDYPNDEAGPSEHKEDAADGSSTIQPVVDEANGKPAFHDGWEDTETDVHKETEKDEKQSHKGDDGENKVDKGDTETRGEPRLNEKLEDESGKDGKEKEKASETEEPKEVEMKDVSEHLDVPEDGEIVEESQASTFQDQDVSVSQGNVVLEEAVTTEEVVEVKTLEEAKERIGVLEKRIEKEIKHRLDLVKQVKSLSKELHKLKGGSILETHAVGVQTDPECIQIYDEQPPTQQAEVYQVVDSSSSMQQGASTSGQTQWAARTQGPSSSSSTAQVQSVAESVRATAEAALAQSGVVLDEASGMYYDYNSGYYYDPNNHLYYDPARGIYYYYDEQTQSYQYHSKIDLPEVVVGGTGGSRSQLDGRRHERDRRKGDRARRRRNHNDQSRDELGTSERPSTSRRIGNTECEVIDITSPAEDYPENGMDTTTSAATTTRTTKPQDAFWDQNDGIDIVEIVDDDDSLRRRHRRRSRSSHSRRKRRKMGSEEERKENGEDLPDVIVIDSEESDMEEGELSDSSSESGGSSKGESGDDAEGDDVSEESMVIDDDDDVQSVEATKVDYPPCVRMIVVRSESMKLGSLSIVTCTGGTIGREGSNHILLVPELGVSKTHAQMSYDAEKKFYTITDLGSQNGTVLNGVPLTKKSRVKSDPQLLSHKDYLTFGTTTLRIHIHRGDETCDECEPGQVQAAFRHQQSMEVTPVLSQADKEQQRRKELRKIKKKYLLAGADYSQREPSRAHPGYKDRAEERRVTVGSDNPYQSDDMPASVDRAISGDNMGHKMLKKMGWKEGQSLGKNESGIKEPIQVFLHSKKSGLGAGSQKSMDSLDLIGKRKSENWERARDRYHHLDQGTSSTSTSTSTSSRQPSRPLEMKWVKGTTQVDDSQNSVPHKDDDGDVEVVGADKETGAVAKDTSNNVGEVAMDDGESKEDGTGSEIRMESISGEVSTKKLIVEETTADGTSKEASSVSGDGSKTIPSSLNNATAGNDATENESSASLESESTSKSDLLNQVDGTNSKQTRLESKIGKDNATEKSASSNSLSHKGEQNSVEVPVEREAAKKPIRFVIPPRMNSKGDSGKTPLTASRSVSENNGEGPSTRRTRQSSRRGKEKRDNIDMFDNG